MTKLPSRRSNSPRTGPGGIPRADPHASSRFSRSRNAPCSEPIRRPSGPRSSNANTEPAASRGARTLEQLQQDTERQAIVAAIAAARGNKAQAARSLGISRASLYEKLAALGISSSTNA